MFNLQSTINHYQIRIMITHNCNYMCEYCPAYDNSEKSAHNIDKMAKFINGLQEKIDKKLEISFFGGEPLLDYKTILEIKEKTNPDMFTVYSNLGVNNLAKIKETGLFKGVKLYSSFHPTRINFQKYLSSVMSLKKEVTEILLFVMFVPGHKENIKKLIKLLNSLKISFVLTKIEGIGYTDDEIKFLESNFSTVYDLTLDENGDISDENYDTLRHKDKNRFKGAFCDVLNSYLWIDHNGDVYPCKDIKKSGGKPFLNIYDDHYNYDFLNMNVQCPNEWCCTLQVHKSSENLFGIEALPISFRTKSEMTKLTGLTKNILE